jgi:hypothetical protein
MMPTCDIRADPGSAACPGAPESTAGGARLLFEPAADALRRVIARERGAAAALQHSGPWAVLAELAEETR